MFLCSYYINLDPAVTQVPFGANIDIRDTVSSCYTIAIGGAHVIFDVQLLVDVTTLLLLAHCKCR
jgi:hypothetical protein